MMTTYRYSFALPSMRAALSFVCALVFALSPSFLNAQQPAKVFRIGELVFRGDRLNLGAGRELFRRALGELGYVEGKNIAFEIRSAGGNPDRFPTLAEELVRLEVDVLIASSVNEVLAFKSATKKIPIVMMSVGADPVEAGLVQSLARPGGNVTGVTDFATEISAKRLELLKEARADNCTGRRALRSEEQGQSSSGERGLASGGSSTRFDSSASAGARRG